MQSKRKTTTGDTAVGARIAEARTAAGLSKRQLARRSGVSNRLVSAVETGRRVPTAAQLQALSAACDLQGETPGAAAGAATRTSLDDRAAGLDGGAGSMELHVFLGEYLDMLAELRNTTIDGIRSLRSDDLEVLARRLGCSPDDIEQRLVDLLETSGGSFAGAGPTGEPSSRSDTHPGSNDITFDAVLRSGHQPGGAPIASDDSLFAAEPAAERPGRDRGKERRTHDRKPVAWEGRFGLNREPEWNWQACEIRDISAGGALITAPADTPVRVNDNVSIAVERLGATSVGVRLHGRVRDRRCTDRGVDIGVELTFDSLLDRRTAEMLFKP